MTTTHDFIEYDQPGGVFYACVLSASDVIHRLDIRRRSESEEFGIQRDENSKRIREIAAYARQPSAILPTPIIVSAYEATVSVSNKKLTIAADGTLGHILDGQHRILGLRLLTDEDLRKIELLVVFVFEIKPFAQATIFTTINSNQKQVSKSLIYDLFGLDPERSLQKSAHEIAKSLNDDESSPFFKRIKLLGKKVQDTETLSQAAFVDRLLDAIKEKDSLLLEFYEKDEDQVIRRVISNAFEGLRDALDAVDNRYPDSFFLKTTGYGGIMKSLNSIISSVRSGKSLKREVFARIFTRFLSKFPDPPEGTGNSAMLVVERNIESTL